MRLRPQLNLQLTDFYEPAKTYYLWRLLRWRWLPQKSGVIMEMEDTKSLQWDRTAWQQYNLRSYMNSTERKQSLNLSRNFLPLLSILHSKKPPPLYPYLARAEYSPSPHIRTITSRSIFMALTPRFTFTFPNKVNAIWTDGTFKLVYIPGTHSVICTFTEISWQRGPLGGPIQRELQGVFLG